MTITIITILTVILAVIGVIPPLATATFVFGLYAGFFSCACSASKLLKKRDDIIREKNETIRKMEYDLRKAKESADLWEYKVRYFYNKYLPEDVKKEITRP